MSRKRTRDGRGFTLMELIVVITIIGILASIVVLNFPAIVERARKKRAVADMKTIVNAVNMYKMDKGSLPQSLEELVNPPENRDGTSDDSFMNEIPMDPWGTPYIYTIEDNKPLVITCGPDKQEGSPDDMTSRDSATKGDRDAGG